MIRLIDREECLCYASKSLQEYLEKRLNKEQIAEIKKLVKLENNFFKQKEE